MKRILTLVFALVLCITACFALASCEKIEHTHTYETEWTSNATHHWHACKGYLCINPTCDCENGTCAPPWCVCQVLGCAVVADKAEHTWNEGVVSIPATAEAEGLMIYTCTGCGVTKNEFIPKDHAYSADWSSDETHHWHECADEGCETTTEKLEHVWNEGVITTPATAAQNGVKTYTCTDCGATKTESVAHTHSYEDKWSYDENKHWYACEDDTCKSASDEADHVWNGGEITVYAAPDANGTKLYTCGVCSATKTESLEFEGVVVNDATELVAALENGGYIALGADITSASKFTVMKDTVIVGCGKTITYSGSDRIIDVVKESSGASLTLVNMTIKSTASWCERAVNYNTSGTLILDGVTVTATNLNYAVNLPSRSDDATVILKNSNLSGFIALNIWGENTDVLIEDSELYSVGNNSIEIGATIALNTDGTNRADNCTITINNSKVSSLYIDGETPAVAIRNNGNGNVISISDDAEIVGDINHQICVAIVAYPPYNSFYAFFTFQGAVSKAAEDKANGNNNAVVVLTGNTSVESLDIEGGVKIDLNGYSLTVGNLIGDSSKLEIVGNGSYNGTAY